MNEPYVGRRVGRTNLASSEPCLTRVSAVVARTIEGSVGPVCPSACQYRRRMGQGIDLLGAVTRIIPERLAPDCTSAGRLQRGRGCISAITPEEIIERATHALR